MPNYTVDNTLMIGKPVHVLLDGERIEHRAIEADTDEGYVIVQMLDKKGKPFIDYTDESGQIAMETLRGKVEVFPAESI